MSWLQRLAIGKARPERDPLEAQLTGLAAALAKCRDVAARGRHLYREAMAAVALLMFAFGLLVGIYHVQIELGVLGLWRHSPDAGYAAYQKGRYATAVELLRPSAEAGDAHAQSTLGLMYYRGGRGLQPDDEKAIKWFRLAAQQRDPVAEFNLGVMYSDGEGVPQDNAEAAKWYSLAADQGDARAEYNLGLWYAQGMDGQPDYVRAHMWFNLAASHFPASDISDRTLAVNNRNVVAGKMTADQIAEAQRRAREWKPK
jgi:TPR repeat protein